MACSNACGGWGCSSCQAWSSGDDDAADSGAAHAGVGAGACPHRDVDAAPGASARAAEPAHPPEKRRVDIPAPATLRARAHGGVGGPGRGAAARRGGPDDRPGGEPRSGGGSRAAPSRRLVYIWNLLDLLELRADARQRGGVRVVGARRRRAATDPGGGGVRLHQHRGDVQPAVAPAAVPRVRAVHPDWCCRSSRTSTRF